ncbi:MAG: M48 family metalloprotease [Planctomycetota bacterium]
MSAAQIDPQDHVAPGTGLHVTLGKVLAVVGPLLAIVASYGIALVVLLVIGVWRQLQEKKAIAQLHGSAVRVGPQQFSAIHKIAKSTAAQIGLDEVPEIYVVETNIQNAAAMKVGRKQFVILTDDIIVGLAKMKSFGALKFVVAHELAHHALGHTGWLRGTCRTVNMRLCRLDEFSCDAVAAAAVGDDEAIRDAFAVLATGPQLFPQLNKDSFLRQAREVAADKNSKKSERGQEHPLLLRRLARLSDDAVAV